MIRRGFAAVLAALALAGGRSALRSPSSRSPSRTSASKACSAPRPAPSSATCRSRSARPSTTRRRAAAVRALYATGFFRDVRLEARTTCWSSIVQERPAIAQIDFAGNKEFEPDDRAQGAERDRPRRGAHLRPLGARRAEQEIKRQYLSRGLYGAEVQTTVTPLERNRVGINITINEGEVAKIRGINIVGAKAFTRERAASSLFELRTPGWLTWYTKNDRYSRRSSSADLETLRSYYQNRGYLEFNVESTQVSITPGQGRHLHHDQHHRGRAYTVSDVQLAGQTLGAARGAGAADAAQAGRRLLAREARRRAPRRSPTASATTATRSPTSTPSRTSTRRSAPSRSPSSSTRAAASTCGASTSPATPRRATR